MAQSRFRNQPYELCMGQRGGHAAVDDWFGEPLWHIEPKAHPHISEDWQDSLPGILHGLTQTFEALLPLMSRLELVEQEIVTLKDRLAGLESSQPLIVPIESLAPEPYEIVKPIHAVVRLVHDGYVASFVDANVNTSGETVFEAVENLKDMMVGTLEVLGDLAEEKLGKMPRQQLSVLGEFIRRA